MTAKAHWTRIIGQIVGKPLTHSCCSFQDALNTIVICKASFSRYPRSQFFQAVNLKKILNSCIKEWQRVVHRHFLKWLLLVHLPDNYAPVLYTNQLQMLTFTTLILDWIYTFNKVTFYCDDGNIRLTCLVADTDIWFSSFKIGISSNLKKQGNSVLQWLGQPCRHQRRGHLLSYISSLVVGPFYFF